MAVHQQADVGADRAPHRFDTLKPWPGFSHDIVSRHSRTELIEGRALDDAVPIPDRSRGSLGEVARCPPPEEGAVNVRVKGHALLWGASEELGHIHAGVLAAELHHRRTNGADGGRRRPVLP